MKTWNIQQCGGARLLNICFHFGVCFQLRAREYAPKCGVGCFSSGNLVHPTFFIFIDLFTFFVLILI